MGPDICPSFMQSLENADTLAGKIGGCARDAYTVLYGCASFAVLFAAAGVAVSDHGLMIYVLGFAELAMLLILLLTFRNAHQVNVRHRWLGLRFHAEVLRCVPILVALPEESSLSKNLLLRGDAAKSHSPSQSTPYLDALIAEHQGVADICLLTHETEQQESLATLIKQLGTVYWRNQQHYTENCLAYARVLAQQQLHYYCLRTQQEQAIVSRSHVISMVAFGFTFVAVLLHFVWHSPLLTIINTGVPALIASLHGFLAQEESERLVASNRQMAIRMHQWLTADVGASPECINTQTQLTGLVELMMSEVQDWHTLFGEKGMYHLG